MDHPDHSVGSKSSSIAKKRKEHRDRRERRDREDRRDHKERKDRDGHRRSEKVRSGGKSRSKDTARDDRDRRERKEGKEHRERREKNRNDDDKSRGGSTLGTDRSPSRHDVQNGEASPVYHRSHEIRGKEPTTRMDVRNLVSMWENIAVQQSQPAPATSKAPLSARAGEPSSVADHLSPRTQQVLNTVLEQSPGTEHRRSKTSHKPKKRKEKKESDRKMLAPSVSIDPGTPQARRRGPTHTHKRRSSWDRSADGGPLGVGRRVSVGNDQEHSRIFRKAGSGRLERSKITPLGGSPKLSPRTRLSRGGPVSSSSDDILIMRPANFEEDVDEDAVLIKTDETVFDVVARWHETPTNARPGDLCRPTSLSTWHLERGGDDIVIGWPGNTSGAISLEDVSNFSPLYRQYCYGEDHENFWGICEGLGPVIITVQADGVLDENRSSLFSSPMPKRPSLKPWKTTDLAHKRSSSSVPFAVGKEGAGASMPAPLSPAIKTSHSGLGGSTLDKNDSDARRGLLGSDVTFHGKSSLGSSSPSPAKSSPGKGSKKRKGDGKIVARVIVRSKNGIQHFFMKTRPGRKEVKRALKTALPLSKQLGENSELGKMKLQPFKGVEGIEDLLLNLEEKMLVNRYKFGVLYVKTIPAGGSSPAEPFASPSEGVCVNDSCGGGDRRDEDDPPTVVRRMQTENEMFQNNDPSKDFIEFLDLLGDKVTLKGFGGYRGGLDVTSDATGTHSYYTKYLDSEEIMFHVSTMLPFFPADEQQVERKRHLGNDIVCIVFIDDDGDDKSRPPWDPDVLTNQFNHVIAVVRKARRGKYHVEFATKVGVRPYAPLLPKRNRIKAGELRDFLLTKLVNGERATLRSPEFLSKLRYTRLSHLHEVIPDDKK